MRDRLGTRTEGFTLIQKDKHRIMSRTHSEGLDSFRYPLSKRAGGKVGHYWNNTNVLVLQTIGRK